MIGRAKCAFPARTAEQTRYILIVLELVRKNARFFLAAGLLGLALRLVFRTALVLSLVRFIPFEDTRCQLAKLDEHS